MKTKASIKNVFKGDIAIWVIYLLFSLISLISVYSSIGLYAIADNHSTPVHIFMKHAIFVVGSYVAIIIVTHLKTNTLYKASTYVFIAAIALVIMAALQHTRWINIFGIRFQPSEVAKLGLSLFLARAMMDFQDHVDTKKMFIILFAIIAIFAGLILPENLSTAALIFLASMFGLFFAGINRKYWLYTMIPVFVLAIIGFVVIYQWGDSIDAFRSSTWSNRLDHWLHPNNELTQENMAKMAIASGQWFGNGPGSTIHARLMTQAHNDFIFAIIIEEFGAVMGIIILTLYTWFFRRCIKLVKRCRDYFSATIVACFGTIIYFQALVNMSVAVGLLPVTGQTLPFISFGGTAYFILSVGIGMIQCVAYNTKIQELKDETTEHTK